jgi:hypothetical protein
MEELHILIQVGMDWSDKANVKGLSKQSFRFYCETPEGAKDYLYNKVKLCDVRFHGKKEIVYEYAKWTVKIIIMSSYQPANNEKTRFIAGEGKAPPEQVEGPRHLKKLLYSLETGSQTERQSIRYELGQDFISGSFDLDVLNRNLQAVMDKET